MFRQESRQRMRLKGTTRAPARDAVPLKNPPGPSIASASVAAFGGRCAAFEKKTYLKLLKSIPTPPAMRPGGGLGVLQSAANLPIKMLAGGKHTLIPAWTGLREQDLQRSPPADFFGYFLVRYKKVTLSSFTVPYEIWWDAGSAAGEFLRLSIGN